MRAIAELNREDVRNLLGVLFDLDDTLLDHGLLTEQAYTGLFQLRAAGLRLLAVTGRPSGWGEVLARIWPVDGLVTENGTIAVIARDRLFEIQDEVDAQTRALRCAKRDQLVAEIRKRFPFLVPANDNRLRRADYTFDIGETQSVPAADVDLVEDFARMQGARTVRSSVHLHVSFDGSDKGSGAVRTIVRSFGVDATLARTRFAFIGDSENDEPAFNTFRITVGVANLRGRPTLAPRFRTQGKRGCGFAEFAHRIATLRSTAG